MWDIDVFLICGALIWRPAGSLIAIVVAGQWPRSHFATDMMGNAVNITRKSALLVLALGLAGAAHAEGPDPIVTRQAGQDLVLGDFTGIRAVVMLKGDVTKLEQPAKGLATWMRQFPSQFPAGSDTGHNTKALPEIWSDPAGFRKAADTMADASDRLGELAKAGDVEGVTAQVKAVGDACGACHRAYRAR
jgi:cytochrome c556